MFSMCNEKYVNSAYKLAPRARVGELAKPMGFEQEPQFVKGRDAENYLLSRGE
jgi:hypothetical protein